MILRRLGVALIVAAVIASVPVSAGAVSVTGVASVGPSVQPPTMAFAFAGRLGGFAVPLKVSWRAAVPSGPPVEHYELERSLDGGAWSVVTLPRPRARSVITKAPPWAVIRYRLRAIDTGGQPGDWTESAPRWMTTAQESDTALHLSSTWQVLTDKAAYGRGRATSTTTAETATFDFVGREVAWVARLGPAQGQAQVSVDGGPATAVNLYRSSASSRRIVFRQAWPTVGPHSVLVTTTSAGAPVDVDAFLVLADPADGTLVGAGDIAVCTTTYDDATASLVSETLAANESATAFTAGDNVYPDGSPENFQNCYEPTWGAFKSRTNPVLGNHDFYNNPAAAGYFGYFGGGVGEPGKGWYRYESGTWRVYALSSECADSACYDAQFNWLSSDLIAEPHACVMAIWHRPLFSTGPHGNSNRMKSVFQLLYDRGAELVVTGHDHLYQRFAPADSNGTVDGGRGVREFVVGTGGASLYGFVTESSLVEVRDNSSHGILKLTLKPGAYAWDFLPAPGDSFTDSSEDSCH